MAVNSLRKFHGQNESWDYETAWWHLYHWGIPEAAIQMGQHFSILLKEEKLSNLKAHTKTVVVNWTT